MAERLDRVLGAIEVVKHLAAVAGPTEFAWIQNDRVVEADQGGPEELVSEVSHPEFALPLGQARLGCLEIAVGRDNPRGQLVEFDPNSGVHLEYRGIGQGLP